MSSAENEPATKADLAHTEQVLRLEMRGLIAELRADLVDKFNVRTTTLFFSQIAAVVAVAAIAFAD